MSNAEPYGLQVSNAEFYGLGGLPNPGPRQFVKAAGLRKFFSQSTFEGEDTDSPRLSYRAYKMGQESERAMAFFAEQERAGVKIHWHTLEFSVLRTGMEALPKHELWRWEVWAE